MFRPLALSSLLLVVSLVSAEDSMPAPVVEDMDAMMGEVGMEYADVLVGDKVVSGAEFVAMSGGEGEFAAMSGGEGEFADVLVGDKLVSGAEFVAMSAGGEGEFGELSLETCPEGTDTNTDCEEDYTACMNSDDKECVCIFGKYECIEVFEFFTMGDGENCPAEAQTTGDTCEEEYAFCLWEADEGPVTDCFCVDGAWDCFTFDDEGNASEISFGDFEEGWLDFWLEDVEYECSAEAYSNGETCDTDGAFCFWEDSETLLYTDCFCFGDEWDCLDMEAWWLNEDGEDSSCPETVVDDQSACSKQGEYCWWEAGEEVTDCFCWEDKWSCFTAGVGDVI